MPPTPLAFSGAPLFAAVAKGGGLDLRCLTSFREQPSSREEKTRVIPKRSEGSASNAVACLRSGQLHFNR